MSESTQLDARRGFAVACLLLLSGCDDATPSASEAEARPAPAAVGPWTTDMLVRRSEFLPEVMWPFAKDQCVYDAKAGLLLRPDHSETWPWPEHPRQKIPWRTNNLGFLETAPTARQKSGLRILLTGDSHLFVTDTDESFANRFEAGLRAAGYEGCEVLTSAVGHTGPRLYLRRIERFLELEPDAIVVSFFVGNDFWEDLLLEYDIFASPTPQLDRGYRERLERCQAIHAGALYQGLNQVHFFKHWPGTADLAFALALRSMDDIHALCRSRGLPLFVVVLPTRMDVDLEDEPEVRADALRTLELSEEEAAANVRLSQRLVDALVERGIPVVDPTQAMRDDPRPFYWRKDPHLANNGHAYVAQEMIRRFEPMLDRFKSPR